jgi:hypothetical protein
MAWWVAVRGSPLDAIGRFELSETAAKDRAVAQSQRHPGVAFQVRYHVNANAPTEVRWEAIDGRIGEMRKDDRTPPSERRIGARHFACFPAHIARTGDVQRTAMMHDLSISGAMLVVNAKLAVGDVVSLQLHVSGDADARDLVAQGRRAVRRAARRLRAGDQGAGRAAASARPASLRTRRRASGSKGFASDQLGTESRNSLACAVKAPPVMNTTLRLR